MVKITIDEENYNELIKKYPACKKEIDEFISSQIKFCEKLDIGNLEYPFGWQTERSGIKLSEGIFAIKYCYIDKIKDSILMICPKDAEESEETKMEYSQSIAQAYSLINNILRKYLDWEEEKYNIVALWIIGTYFHDSFPSYPYLFLNAMRGSGKSRALNIICSLSKDGKLLNSLTEATIFRTKGTLGIDECEGLERKGKESLKELLNSAYKQGINVIRMKKVRTPAGEEQVAEEFNVYRPIVMANISGMESVLGDRCIPLIIEKSFNKKFVNLIEVFRHEDDFKKAKELLEKCSKCRCRCSGETIQMYQEWNNFVINNNTNNTNNTIYTNNTNSIKALKGLNLSFLTGRELELSFPLCIIASEISENLSTLTTLTLSKIFSEKKDEDLIENTDISLIDFISQEPPEREHFFQELTTISKNFQAFVGISEDWINSKWMTRALERVGLIKEKKRGGSGVKIMLNITKAKEKIKNFRN